MYSFGISNILKVTQQTSEGGKRINYCNFAISYVEYYAASSPVPPFFFSKMSQSLVHYSYSREDIFVKN